jgi:hypothetical protein
MLNLQSLQNLAGGQKAIVAALRRTLDSLNAQVAKFESDKTYSMEYIAKSVNDMREAAVPKMLEQLQALREGAEVANKHRRYWQSRPLLLFHTPFHSDPAIDAAMRLRYAAELPQLDLPLLLLTMNNALEDKNLALAWACVLNSRPKGGDTKLFNLAAAEIPGQAAALALIDACSASEAEGVMIEAGIRGKAMDPVRKLTVAHAMQPNPATSHNSR